MKRCSAIKTFRTLIIIVVAFSLSSTLALHLSGNKLDLPRLIEKIVRYFGPSLSDSERPRASKDNQKSTLPIDKVRHEFAKKTSAPRKTDRLKRSDNHGEEYQCSKTESPTGILEVDAEAIYRWTDNDGNTQFSDTSPTDYPSQKVSNIKAYDFFSLEVSYPTGRKNENLRDAIEIGGRAIYKIYAHYLPFNLMTKSKIEVQIFSDKPSYDHFRETYAPSVTTNTNGFFSSSTNQAIVSGHQSAAQTLETSLHEIAHAIHAGNFGRTPKWYNEGMAEVFENVKSTGSQRSIAPNASWTSALGKRLPILKLQKLLSSTSDDWNGIDRNTYYANSWSLAFYLMQPRNADFMSLLQVALTEERCNTLDTVKYVDSNYQGGVRALERDWRRWIQNGRLDILRF